MKILSIDGGGYLGLASASFLQAIEHDLDASCYSGFDLFCGTSTGAIIALALATGKTAQEVCALYESLGPRVFPPPGFLARHVPKLRGLLAARHDNGPLKESLRDAFGDATLGDLRSNGKLVLVTAFSLTTGRPRIFKTDHAPGLTAHDRYLIRDVALASAAAPTYLPIVPLRDPATGSVERFCDGGIAANSPALLGYVEAVSDLGACPNEISLLSLATPRADLSEPASGRTWAMKRADRGYLGWGLGERLITLALDGSAMLSDTALARLARSSGARYERIRFGKPTGVDLDKVTPDTTETLQTLGSDRARSGDVRDRLRPFFR